MRVSSDFALWQAPFPVWRESCLRTSTKKEGLPFWMHKRQPKHPHLVSQLVWIVQLKVCVPTWDTGVWQNFSKLPPAFISCTEETQRCQGTRLEKESTTVTSINWSVQGWETAKSLEWSRRDQELFMLLGVGRLAQREKYPLSSLKALPSPY